MKLFDIVTNALEICDIEIENACFCKDEDDLDLYVKLQKKNRDWYLRRLIKSG